MPVRMFADDAHLASTTSLPVPRGIALLVEPPDGSAPSVVGIQVLIANLLPGWGVREIQGLAGWYELTPPKDAPPMPLGSFWDTVRTLRNLPAVTEADPLFLVANPQPDGEVETEAFGLGFGQEQFGLWGMPYDPDLIRRMQETGAVPNWHLAQLRVPEAWALWLAKHPGGVPGDGIVVGHPDTGFSDHVELKDRLLLPGRSFLLDANGEPEQEARDDLGLLRPGFLQNPGHGTSTASVIASGEHDETEDGKTEAFGVAPGARVLPLRVSRSVVHFDFGNVGNAILHAASEGADVISMSLGGPGYSSFLRACIGKAQEQGVIVVSAAGNNVPTVVFPAAFPEVVAVAATHAAEGPWRFTGLGANVDIAAPGENVWCARASLTELGFDYSVGQGTGTSFATACVAGLAALWLSYWGGRQAVADQYGGRLDLVPFAFQYLLAATANKQPELAQEGKYGAGIADAQALLAAALPDADVVERFALVVRAQPVTIFSTVSGLFGGLFGLAERPSVAMTADDADAANGRRRPQPPEQCAVVLRADKEQQDARQRLGQVLGDQTDDLAPELLARVAADRLLLVGFQRWRHGQAMLPFLDRMLAPPTGEPTGLALSDTLKRLLVQRREREEQRLAQIHRGRLVPGVSLILPPLDSADGAIQTEPPTPGSRRLRAYAFDPSLATKLDTARIHQVTIPTRWEHVLPGPVGEYLEVVDIDPSSGCAYSPVDLNHPHVLGQDGLPPSEGSPQFHQQMVYAVAMNTIERFELALGRPVFWSPLRPWLRERPDERSQYTAESLIPNGLAPTDPMVPDQVARRDRYVQRLRIYPHALREANAYYSPKKRALLFGYFPGADDDTGRHYPGGMVFTCLSHDIVAHETTHALLDGMHPYFNEPSNIDVWAFHEAFADVMALFQHFTYPEVLSHQIANTRGDLETNNMLGQLAQQFGEATGQRGSLRDALGKVNEKGEWERTKANPRALHTITEPHQRGSILIAAVFDAFLSLYNDRVADLLRIYTGGTGILPAGQIHPDLVNRLAREAASIAEEVLRVCIRAMDYVPPVDITFGEFLRGIITADWELSELSPSDRRRNRIAFIDAFRSWGIYPRDVPSLSEESLRWRGPQDGLRSLLGKSRSMSERHRLVLTGLVRALEEWQPGSDRGAIFQHVLNAQGALHDLLAALQAECAPGESYIPGLDLTRSFNVANLRPARRIGLRGQFRTEMVVEVVQTHRPPPDSTDKGGPYRGGATLIVDVRSWTIRYMIYKRLWEEVPQPARDGQPAKPGVLAQRFSRPNPQQTPTMQAAWSGEDAGSLSTWLAETYACTERLANRRKKSEQEEPFALLHRDHE